LSLQKTIQQISNRTGLKPKGRNFTIINSTGKDQVRFEVRAKEVLVHRMSLIHKEEVIEQRVTPDNAASYIHGYLFSFGFIDERGDKITSANQLKKRGNNTMKTQTNKTTKKAPVRTASTGARGKAYGLGKPVKASDRTKVINALNKEFPDGMTYTAAARALILKNWDNDSCINGIGRLTGYEDLTDADINKVRRMLRRKGDWK